jgi:ABC-type uncharacterized transport system permease subunit
MKVKEFFAKAAAAVKKSALCVARGVKSFFVGEDGKEAGIKTMFRSIGNWFKGLFKSVNGKEPKLRVLIKSESFHAFSASLMSILIGIVFGAILMIIFNPPAAGYGLFTLLTKGLSNIDKFGEVLYYATPLVMTGLSVAFAFKTGLFNIGASGQYLTGAFFALYAAIVWQFPWWACILMAMVGGALLGAIPGIFKALLNVNEVITCIMFNWISLFAVNLAVSNIPQMLPTYYGGYLISETVPLKTVNKSAIIPNLQEGSYFFIGIFIAIVIAVVIYIILNKTTFGYELKACGHNRNAARYAGINEKRSIILSMIIAGALAGIGGGLYYLSGTAVYKIVKALQAAGFNGIPVALLASSNPIGVIFSALFISYIQVGGNALTEYAREVTSIIISVIIYLSAFALFFRNLIANALKNRKEKELKTGPAADMSSSNDGAGILPDSVTKEE